MLAPLVHLRSSRDMQMDLSMRGGSNWMMSVASVRFWQPAPEAGTELVCAYLETSEAPPHFHEEWQFGVLEVPSKLSLGAYRRYSVSADDVTIVRSVRRAQRERRGWHRTELAHVVRRAIDRASAGCPESAALSRVGGQRSGVGRGAARDAARERGRFDSRPGLPDAGEIVAAAMSRTPRRRE